MRVLQLIDSLQTGGAERVAVNLANELSKHIDKSYLCATRQEGLLKESILPSVNYCFLNKKNTIDLKAFKAIRHLIATEKIDIIHAHSSSFFLATLVKLFNEKVKIVWHDHYGNSEFLENRSSKILTFCSHFFSKIYSVNEQLVSWAKKKLHPKNVSYLPNFVVSQEVVEQTKLKGLEGRRIVCIANLRPQKNHKLLLQAFSIISKNYPDWTLHFVGKDFDDKYSKEFFNLIEFLQINESVFFYGSQSDTDNIIKQASIGVLPSNSEGLPLTLLEYGLGKLAVIATNVGDCSKVIKDDRYGFLIEKGDEGNLVRALTSYIENQNLRDSKGFNLHEFVQDNFSSKVVIKKIISEYNLLLNKV